MRLERSKWLGKWQLSGTTAVRTWCDSTPASRPRVLKRVTRNPSRTKQQGRESNKTARKRLLNSPFVILSCRDSVMIVSYRKCRISYYYCTVVTHFVNIFEGTCETISSRLFKHRCAQGPTSTCTTYAEFASHQHKAGTTLHRVYFYDTRAV